MFHGMSFLLFQSSEQVIVVARVAGTDILPFVSMPDPAQNRQAIPIILFEPKDQKIISLF